MTVEGDQLYTVQEVADYLRCSSMTVYRQIKAGKLNAVRVGKNYRIPSSALSEYVALMEVRGEQNGQ